MPTFSLCYLEDKTGTLWVYQYAIKAIPFEIKTKKKKQVVNIRFFLKLYLFFDTQQVTFNYREIITYVSVHYIHTKEYTHCNQEWSSLDLSMV